MSAAPRKAFDASGSAGLGCLAYHMWRYQAAHASRPGLACDPPTFARARANIWTDGAALWMVFVVHRVVYATVGGPYL